MYNDFYHFREKPFSLTPDPEFLYRSRAHKRALAYLEYGIRDPSGFVCITGEIGAGKTTLIRVFLNQLEKPIRVARVFNTRVTARQLLEMVLQDLGIRHGGKSKADMIHALNRGLIDIFADGGRVVLVIDEAQNLSVDLLEEIRLLSNLETEKTKLLQIFLVGQSELRELIQHPGLEQLRQRITVNYHIPPLKRSETGEYIRHRLRVASLDTPPVFPEEVVDMIQTYSRGVPRLINVICDALLLYGFVEERRDPDLGMIREVIRDMVADGTLRSPGKTGVVKRDDGEKSRAFRKELKGFKANLQALEARQQVFEETLKGLIRNNRMIEEKSTELLNRMEELHRRERILAVEQERLRNRERELMKREREVAERSRPHGGESLRPPGTGAGKELRRGKAGEE